jgi:hypothetical protein
MRFILTYEGPLPPNGRPEAKNRIRLVLSPQLEQLWQFEHSLSNRGPFRFSFVVRTASSPSSPLSTRLSASLTSRCCSEATPAQSSTGVEATSTTA